MPRWRRSCFPYPTATSTSPRSRCHGNCSSAYLATFWRRGKYYRTYAEYVEDEVRAALAKPDDFERGPKTLSKRGTRDDHTHAFVVEDGRYVSGRWPGDAYLIATKLSERLQA